MARPVNEIVGSSLCETGECELPVDLAAVEPAVALLLGFLRQKGASPETIAAVELATVEGLNNAIKHGATDPRGAGVGLRWQLRGGELTIAVTDPGHFNAGPAWFELPADPLAESGRGGFLIRSLMDGAVHENGPTRHTLRMHKHLGPLAPPPATADLERELAAMTQDLSDSYENLAALFSISEALATSPDFTAFLKHGLTRLRSLVAADVAFVRFKGNDGVWRIGSRSADTDSLSGVPAEPGPLEVRAWTERRELMIEQTANLPARDPLRSMSGSFICPIIFADHPLGLLVVGRRNPDFFSAGQLNLVRTVGDYLAIMCANADLQRERDAQARVAREFQIAASIQASLLPTQMPELRSWQAHGACQNASEVGGDYYDVLGRPDGSLLVVIADVMGKGLPAALVASMFRAAVRARAEDLATDPGRLLTAVNRQLYDDLAPLNIFVTAQIGYFDPSGGEGRFASAGHGDILRIASGRARAFGVSGPGEVPIGVLPDTTYGTVATPITTSELILFSTDGLYEFQDTTGRQYGFGDLPALVPPTAPLQPEAFLSCLLHAITMVAEEGPLADDRTLVAVRRKSPP